jgi:hypothetical protein
MLSVGWPKENGVRECKEGYWSDAGANKVVSNVAQNLFVPTNHFASIIPSRPQQPDWFSFLWKKNMPLCIINKCMS